MLIIPYGKDFSDRGPGKPPLAGILGLEVFERFAVTIDYAGHTLRLQTPQSFTPRAGDVAVPLVFQDDMPLAYATVDGTRGLFGIDTGNSGPIYLFGDYLRHHGFFPRYDAGAAGLSTGTGGTVRSSTHRLRDVSLGGLTMHNFVADSSSSSKARSRRGTEAGNIGHDVLAQFTVTTDYARAACISIARPAHRFRSSVARGSWAACVMRRITPSCWASWRTRLPPTPGSPRVTSFLALDGTPTEGLSLTQMIAASRLPVGTLQHLTVQSGTNRHEVTLTLRELLCNPHVTRCGPWVESTPTAP